MPRLRPLLRPLIEVKRLGQMLGRQGPVGTFWAGVDKAYRWRRGGPLARFSHVSDALWLGGQPSAKGLHALARAGVTGIVNLRSEHDYVRLTQDVVYAGPEGQPVGLRYLHLPVDDNTAPAPDLLVAGVDFIRAEAAHGGRVFVHCWEGLGRGPTLAAAYFVSEGDAPDEAWARLRRTRPFIRPVRAQEEALRRFARTYREGASGVAEASPAPGGEARV